MDNIPDDPLKSQQRVGNIPYKYVCPCCGVNVDLSGKTVNECLTFITKWAEKNGYDSYEQMIKFLADNEIDLAVPSCVKVL